MAKFPYGGFGDGKHEKDPPWTKLATIREHLEDGEQAPPELARWLGEAIKGANCDPMALLVGLGLRQPKGRPSTWSDPDAPAALEMLYQLTFAGDVSDEAAIRQVQSAFMSEEGDDRFSRPTLQRWLAAVRFAEDEARASRED